MQEAMDRLQEEQNATTTSKPDILEYLAFSTYMQGMIHIYRYIWYIYKRIIIYVSMIIYSLIESCLGNVARALSMTNELLELVPTHERALGNRAYYQKEIQSKASQSKKKRGEDGQDDTAVPAQVR